MKREEWKFQFSVEDLTAAAQSRATYHREHEAEWSEKYDAWDQEMNDSAKVEEVPITGGVQRVLRYDQGLQNKVNTAQTKRDGHKNKAEGYERWVRAFKKANADQVFGLDIDDVTYFEL